jgi:hypothetical protein
MKSTIPSFRDDYLRLSRKLCHRRKGLQWTTHIQESLNNVDSFGLWKIVASSTSRAKFCVKFRDRPWLPQLELSNSLRHREEVSAICWRAGVARLITPGPGSWSRIRAWPEACWCEQNSRVVPTEPPFENRASDKYQEWEIGEGLRAFLRRDISDHRCATDRGYLAALCLEYSYFFSEDLSDVSWLEARRSHSPITHHA